MAAIPAWPVTISAGDTPVTLSAAATTELQAGVYQISAASQQRLDPATTVTVKVDGVTQSGGYSVDYLFGIVTFDVAPDAGSAITVSGKYVPVVEIAQAKEVTVSVTNDVVELGAFGNGYKTRQCTLGDFSGSLSGLSLASALLGDSSLQDRLDGDTPLLIEVDKGSAGNTFRAWVKIQDLEAKLNPGALFESTTKFIGYAFQSTDGEWVAWGYN